MGCNSDEEERRSLWHVDGKLAVAVGAAAAMQWREARVQYRVHEMHRCGEESVLLELRVVGSGRWSLVCAGRQRGQLVVTGRDRW